MREKVSKLEYYNVYIQTQGLSVGFGIPLVIFVRFLYCRFNKSQTKNGVSHRHFVPYEILTKN